MARIKPTHLIAGVLGIAIVAGTFLIVLPEVASYASVIDQFQHVPAGDDAAGGHWHTAGLFDNRAQLIERFKYSVHGATLQACW